ncbi:Zinc/iron permease [Cladorrhinum samala]|uniref:Zinc/iron permease n=1 Tax=Cladorrhinum samala TaxID=585594 RepID=A0AAV9HYB0_9PEZI|nr:Zinc/iron permease [Cladorrhinum samala]
MFDPERVDLTDEASIRDVICFITSDDDDGGNSRTGLRIAAIFTILVTSTFCTAFPIWATRAQRYLPLYFLLFARYFGVGVIIATAFIHLLVPAYESIGPMSCVGATGGWQTYTWPPAIAMVSFMMVFLMGFLAEWYLERRCDRGHHPGDKSADVEGAIPLQAPATHNHHQDHQFLHSGDQDAPTRPPALDASKKEAVGDKVSAAPSRSSSPDQVDDAKADLVMRGQIVSFLVLEFGVIFHSVIIGLNLGVTGPELTTLFPVLTFHQAFEGLGIGTRISTIRFSRRLRWVPWAACIAYGLTTPISIAIGMGVSHSYDPGSYTANVVSGLLDSISAGILLYTGAIELLARDFLFNPERTRDNKQITFMLVCLCLGMAIMALLGKWA